MKNSQKGFTLFAAMVITSTLLLVSMGVVALAVRESFLSSAGEESQYAFYAADTGIDCAIYWDVKSPTGYSAFSTSTGSTIYCNNDSNNPSNAQLNVGGVNQSTFTLTFLPQPYCATVKVTKNDNGTTQIESYGYNTCDTTDPHRVERAVRAKY